MIHPLEISLHSLFNWCVVTIWQSNLAKGKHCSNLYGYGSIPINTIFRGMNIHLPAILMFTRGTRFWHIAISVYIHIQLIVPPFHSMAQNIHFVVGMSPENIWQTLKPLKTYPFISLLNSQKTLVTVDTSTAQLFCFRPQVPIFSLPHPTSKRDPKLAILYIHQTYVTAHVFQSVLFFTLYHPSWKE